MPKGASSLVLAEERDGELVYAGRVGSGIGDAKARELYAAARPRTSGPTRRRRPEDAGRALGRAAIGTSKIGYRSRSSAGRAARAGVDELTRRARPPSRSEGGEAAS